MRTVRRALEACEAQADDGEGRDNDYSQGYEHGYCPIAGLPDDSGRYYT